MKVIIAGSRVIAKGDVVMGAHRACGFDITEVVSGTARGVDTLGEIWAEGQNIPIKRFPPDWGGLGKAAGFIRNVEMGKYADGLLAIWDGESKGTKHMIDIMEKMNKPVYVYLVPK